MSPIANMLASMIIAAIGVLFAVLVVAGLTS
jgi:hypothetical protein